MGDRLAGFGAGRHLEDETGRTDPDDLHRVVSSGFDDYLAKPVSFDKLDALLSARLAVAPRSPLND